MDKPRNYFEGTLQLRNPSQEVIDFVADLIEAREGVWIAKTEKARNGIDLKLSSNKVLREIGRRLQRRFPGELKESKSLFTRNRQTQKAVYRGTVCFRFVPIERGQRVTVRGDELEVVSWDKDILCRDVETGRKVRVRFSEI